MKKIFFFALASLALASCSQDEEFVAEKANGSARTNKEALSFSSYTAGGTRSTDKDVTSSEVKASGFQVAARYDKKLYFADNALFEKGLSIDNSDVETGAFDTEADTYWWPRLSATDTIGFRAFNNLSATNPAAWLNEKYCDSIVYEVAAKAEEQEDLVIAYATADKKPMAGDAGVIADGVQPLNFTHALSKVNFTFKGENDNYKYTINKVEVIAAGQPTGTFAKPVMKFNETTQIAGGDADGDQPETRTQNDKVSWLIEPIKAYASATEENPLVQKNSTETSAPKAQGVLYTYYADGTGVVAADLADKDMMLYPQTGEIAIRVYYKVEDKKGKLIGNCGYALTDAFGRQTDNADYDATSAIYGYKTVVVNLGTDTDDSPTALAIPAWEAGKAYRFTLTLPTDNFIGDLSGDKVPDMTDGTDDFDGDRDTDPSEFDQLTPIRFSVTVSDWVDVAANNITIK
ncbi:MAG: fimbrillin family protein [Paludibacteraceae bacterium]|nr:fimbrillin family protein [Paludibacteraceae bacterium]